MLFYSHTNPELRVSFCWHFLVEGMYLLVLTTVAVMGCNARRGGTADYVWKAVRSQQTYL